MIGVRWENGHEVPFRGRAQVQLTDDAGLPFVRITMQPDWIARHDVIVIEALDHQTNGTSTMSFVCPHERD